MKNTFAAQQMRQLCAQFKHLLRCQLGAKVWMVILADRFDAFISAVSEFHGALVEVSGTQTLSFMNQLLLNLTDRHQIDYQRRHPSAYEHQKKRLGAGLRSYEKLVDLIEAGEVEDAVKHWRLHLTNANATWAGDDEGGRVVDALGG